MTDNRELAVHTRGTAGRDRAGRITRRHLLESGLAVGGAMALPGFARADAGNAWEVVSPDGALKVVLRNASLVTTWEITRDETAVLSPSPLGLVTADGRVLGRSAQVMGVSRQDFVGRWTPVFGIASDYSQAAHELTLHLLQDRYAFDIVVRVYDVGAAMRYRIVSTPDGRDPRLAAEQTGFNFNTQSVFYASRDEGETRATSVFDFGPAPDPALTASSDHLTAADLPITVDLANGYFAFMAESDRIHYPRTMIRARGQILETYLMHFPARATGWGQQDVTPEEAQFTIGLGQPTPWRIVIVTHGAPALIETAGLIPTLARPSALADTSWIRPGRAIRVTKFTTEHTLSVIDFAAKHKLEYVEFDAHWYGDGTDAGDASVPIPALDMARIVEYGRARNVRIILYLDRVAISRDRDRLLGLYQKWGIAGLKLGFMWEGRQSDIDFIYETVKACGEHQLIVDLHDDLRPVGLERTLPNYLALEGVRGNEHFPPARHNVNLAFTRAIAGPIDYTICYAAPRNQTTNAHQLAMAVVYYNPLTFLYWYDSPEKFADKPWPDLAWFDECPTTWDETKSVAGKLGEFVAVARRRGNQWFLGVLTNEQSRDLELDIGFLGAGAWKATRYADGDVSSPAWQTKVVITKEVVTKDRVLKVCLNPAGGQAVQFDRSAT